MWTEVNTRLERQSPKLISRAPLYRASETPVTIAERVNE